MKVVSTLVAFRDGKRIRPGVVFEIPDGEKLGAGMREAGTSIHATKGDTKPAEAQAVAKAKQEAGNGESAQADTKPADAQAAVKAKTGHGSSKA